MQKMKWFVMVASLTITSIVWAEDHPDHNPGIMFPVPTIVPTPTPEPSPTPVPVLEEGEYYVVTSPSPFFLEVPPDRANLVTINYAEGPIKILAKFFDGDGKYETRTFPDKYIALVNSMPGAKGEVALVGIPAGLTKADQIVWRMIRVGNGPQPPPDPDPEPEPEPGPTPTPAPEGFRVLFFIESGTTTLEQKAITGADPRIESYLDSHCVKDANGDPEWRVIDPDQTLTSKFPPNLKTLLTAVATDTTVMIPKVVIASDKNAHIYPLPSTADEMLNLLKKYGGE